MDTHTTMRFSSFVLQRPFWGWFVLALACNLVAIWLPVWPFGQDSIAWIELLDVVGRYHDPNTLYAQTYEVQLLFEPNSLLLASGWWFGEVFSSVILVRLWLSFYVLCLPLSALYLCWVYQRSQWLALLVSPLAFGYLYTLGLLNYLICIPILLWLVGLGQRFVEFDNGRLGWGLSFGLLLLFHAHMIGFLVGGTLCATVLLFSLRSWKELGRFWVFGLSLLPASLWFLRKFIGREKTVDGATLLDAKGGLGFVFKTLGQRVDSFFYDSVGIFREASFDYAFFVFLFGLFVVFFFVEKRKRFLEPSRNLSKGFWRDVQDALRSQILGFFACCIAIVYFLAPSHTHNLHYIAERLPTLVLIFWIVSLRVKFTGKMAWFLPPIVALSIIYPLLVAAQTSAYMKEHVGPLRAAFAKMPPKSKVHVVEMRPYNRVYTMRVLLHLTKSMNAYYTGGVTDYNFANTPYNAIRYRPRKRPISSTKNTLVDGCLYFWDYLVVRSDVEVLAAKQNPALTLFFHWKYWWIYQVVPRHRKGTTALLAGGRGGCVNDWDCPEGYVLRGFYGQVTNHVSRILPVCRRKEGRWHQTYGPSFGPDLFPHKKFQMVCDPQSHVVGIYGYAGPFVWGLGLYCALSKKSALPSTLRTFKNQRKSRISKVYKRFFREGEVRMPPVGEVWGKWFERRCPKGQVALGFRGRVGDLVDAVGISCGRP